MVDVPIHSSSCTVLIDSRNIGETRDRCKPNKRCCTKKCIASVISVVLIILIVLKFSISFVRIVVSDKVRTLPEITFTQRVLIWNFDEDSTEKVIDGNSLLKDEGLINEMPTTERDFFATNIRFKREISRSRRDCEMSAERCGKLVQTMESYLATLRSNALSNGNPVSVSDILNCLRCKNSQSAVAKKLDKDSTPRTRDEYLSNDYVEQNRSNDFGISAIKLLDDAKRAEVNRTEAAKGRVTESFINDVSQNSVDRSLKPYDISQTTALSIDRTNYSNQQVDNPTTVDSRTMGIDENSFATVSSTDQQIESEGTTSEMVTLQFNTTESSSTTQYTATKDDAISNGEIDHSTETNTQYSINLTTQIAIAENVTSMPAGHDVTGIDNPDDSTVNPSEQPSFEGYPENQSATTIINVSESSGDHSFLNKLTSDDRSQMENSNESIEATTESMKPFQKQLQMLHTMLHPVCIFDPSVAQNRELSFQKSPYQDSPSSNYMQLQTNKMQFIPGFGYAGNQAQTQPAEENTDLTRSVPSNVSPINQPMTRKPYFCGYMSLPTLHYPSIPDTLQSGRFSANKMKDSSGEKIFPKAGIAAWDYSTYKCPKHYYQCDNLFCIPKTNRCDGYANCFDVSDETNCSCRDRVLRNQICDGYFDCPHGEDELGCFDCPADSFSCNYNSNKPLRHNCVPLSQRCDGIKQCSNGKDELDCTILSESYISPKDISTVGYTQGYLHKNIQGQWYPVCSATSASWAINACVSEMDQPLTAMPDIRVVRVPKNTFQDPYVKEINGQINLTSCSGAAVYVKCPPLPCGIKNHYDSFRSADIIRNDFVSKEHPNEQHISHKFGISKLYQQTLGLLNANRSAPEKEQDENDTLVGAQSRVVGGRASQPRAWPFLVAIYKDGRFHCGGVILSEIYVLTASHCMEGYEKHYYEVQAGLLRRFSFSPTAQSRKAKLVILHPDYENENMQNDVSIVMLDKPFLFNRWVRQVCLPSSNVMGSEWKMGPSPQSMCVAIGWGALKEDGPNSNYLREVEVPILPKCNHLSDQNDATICAGYPEGGQDTCQGDSGGPLMCRNRNFDSQWYVAGLVSHGDGCARPNEPGVYMKISYFVDWIQQVSLSNNTESFYKNNNKRPLPKCPTFSCDDGKCLPMEERCDQAIDCLNGEDELGCYPFEVMSPTLNMNDRKYKQSDFEVGKSKDEISDDDMKNQIGITEMSTETVSIVTSHRFFYETQNIDEKFNTADVYAVTPETTSARLTFTCKSLIQTITINKRCDGHVDCEDATDEKDCTCRDYLSNKQPMAICDGHLDCDDETDEKDCDICKIDEFYCSKSDGCIPMLKRCDGEFDCPLNEDELDCLVLTDGEYVNVHSDDQPVLKMEGLLSRHDNGVWRVQCLEEEILNNNTITSIIGRNLCEYLGFANLQAMDKVVANNTVLKKRFWRKWDNLTSYEPSPEYVASSEEDELCTTLRIRCRPVLSSSVDTHLIVNPKSGSHYLWPWLAAIFVDGHYRCSALLLEPDWLLSSSSCTKDIKLSENYTTALLGQSRSYLYVDGPYQQISIVDEIRNVKTSEASLLHLKTAVNFTRYTQPLFLEKKIYPPAKNDFCVALGTDKEHVTRSIFLRPVLENCDNCYRCFVEISGFECPVNETLSDWSGTVFCRSEKGWYPAAVFHENNFCSFRNTRNLTSIDYIHAFLIHALESEPKPTPEPTCDGVRCNIGQCVPWNQVCDNMMDCRDGADETDDMCMYKLQQNSDNNKFKECAKSELQCKNGECISKGAFCDAKVDCSDGTDEPIRCTCADYLSLTIPERLCDGVRHCLDKTDESPEMCQCTQTSTFKCNANINNVTCIPQDFVCDGDEDCPDGEDEEECMKLEESTDNRPGTGEVKQRSYGVWHSKCFSSPVTSQEEAKFECQELGYADGRIDFENQTLSEPVTPSLDDFYMIRLNPDMWITMRDDKPLITLIKPEESCYRLFVTCN